VLPIILSLNPKLWKENYSDKLFLIHFYPFVQIQGEFRMRLSRNPADSLDLPTTAILLPIIGRPRPIQFVPSQTETR